MYSYPKVFCARKTPPRKEARKRRMELSSHDYALLVGDVIAGKLKEMTNNGKLPPNKEVVEAVAEALCDAGLDCSAVKLKEREVHAIIGYRRHGHVIVPLRTQMARYCRGVGEPRGWWNHRLAVTSAFGAD
jgi:hypothetical protein